MSVRVLVIDTDATVRRMVADHGRSLGFDVEACHAPSEGLELASLSPFDVVVISNALMTKRTLDALSALRPAPGVVLINKGDEETGIFCVEAPLDRARVTNALLAGIRQGKEAATRRRFEEAGRKKRRRGAAPLFRIGTCDVEAALGWGELGPVYSCREPISGESRALKLIPLELLTRTGGRRRWLDRFRRAAGAAVSVNHPALVRTVDYGLDENAGAAYVVSELRRDHTLDERLAHKGALSAAQALRLTYDVALGLSALHRGGQVHGRVTPKRIFVSQSDHGALGGVGIGPAVAWDRLPLDGPPLGTRDVTYLSPEQLLQRRVDRTTDQYSLGAVLFEALSGHTWLQDAGDARRRRRALFEPRPEPSAELEAPSSLLAVLDRTLCVEPAHRFPSDEKLIEALLASADDVGIRLKSDDKPRG